MPAGTASSSDELPPGTQADGLPDYYRQNFHFQSDGWLSEHSATLYDTQVEVLFTGAADVMRRRAMKPIADWLAGRNQRELRGLDVGCGTGRHARLPARCLARPALDRPRPQPALPRRSAPPDRPHGAREADRGRGREAAVRGGEPRSRRLVVPVPRAARRRAPCRAEGDGARAEARRPRGDRRFDPEAATSRRGTACSTSSRTISTSPTTPSTPTAASTPGRSEAGLSPVATERAFLSKIAAFTPLSAKSLSLEVAPGG